MAARMQKDPSFGPKVKAFREALEGDATDVLSAEAIANDTSGHLAELNALRTEVATFCESFPTVGFEVSEMTYPSQLESDRAKQAHG